MGSDGRSPERAAANKTRACQRVLEDLYDWAVAEHKSHVGSVEVPALAAVLNMEPAFEQLDARIAALEAALRDCCEVLEHHRLAVSVTEETRKVLDG